MIGSRWYNTLVALFWLTAMSWLLVAKVIPPLVVGDPPTYRSILASQRALAKDQRQLGPLPVAWRLVWDNRELGWAATYTRMRPNELTELRSHVHLNELPLAELAGMRLAGAGAGQGLDALDAQGTVAIDPLGRLNSLWSRISIGGLSDAIGVQGRVLGAELQLTIRSGNFVYSTNTPLSADAVLADALAPQTHLPGLRIGQKWSVPVFSPFRPPSSPMQIMQATVEREEVLVWEHRGVRCWLVVYRSDEGSGASFTKEPQGRIWVRREGTVLKQELKLMGGYLEFVRFSDEQGAAFLKAQGTNLTRAQFVAPPTSPSPDQP